jgi:HD-GYP domain-containing protein (c-di-GMP phosphodiesterase class II)
MTALPACDETVELAGGLLSSLDARWAHTQVVGAKAAELAATVDEEDQLLLVTAGWWHDLGYAPELRDTTVRLPRCT